MSESRATRRPWDLLDVGRNTKFLLKSLWTVGPFFFLARALTAGTQVLAGRWLGPQEFGLATIALAAAGTLLIPIQMGFPVALVKFAAMEESLERQAAIVSSVLWMALIWGLPCLALLILFRNSLGSVLHIGQHLYLWALAYAVLTLAYSLISGGLQGVMRFRERARIELYYGALVPMFFGALYFRGDHSFTSFVGAMCLSLAVAGAVCAAYLKPWIRPSVSGWTVRPVASYTLAPVVSASAGAAVSAAAPLILAAYLSPKEAGFFGIYEIGSVGVSMAAFQIVNTVLAPMASAQERQAGVWRKFLLLSAPLAAALALFFASTTLIILKLEGGRYPENIRWIALFALAGALSFLFSAVVTILSSSDAAGLWLGASGNILAGVLCLAASFWLIPTHGVSGAAAALAAGYAAAFFWCVILGWGKIRSSRA